MRFTSLVTDVRSGDPLGESQERAAKQFPDLIAATPLHYWRPSDPISSKGRRVLLGVATYSAMELYLLDMLVDALAGQVHKCDRVDVFDLLDCKSMAEFEKYLTGVGQVVNSPIMGIWIDGQLREIVRYGNVYERLAAMYSFVFDPNMSPDRVGLRKRGLT